MHPSHFCLTFAQFRIEYCFAGAEIAQLVEHAAENRSVRSSILRLGILGTALLSQGSAVFLCREKRRRPAGAFARNLCYNRFVRIYRIRAAAPATVASRTITLVIRYKEEPWM